MILEFCGGGDLHHYYPTPLFTDSEFQRVLTELLSGVIYLHSRKLAHRDLKPANGHGIALYWGFRVGGWPIIGHARGRIP